MVAVAAAEGQSGDFVRKKFCQGATKQISGKRGGNKKNADLLERANAGLSVVGSIGLE